jgi:L-ascorbate metabolism protein UlaG (beta-lactamase superfamily)
MSKQTYYLRPNVQLDPLVNQWYAWSHLISPATAAMSIANAHVKIMKSFVSAPEIHVAAINNPAMRGGPFIDLPASSVGEVRALLQKTIREQAHMLELAGAIKHLNDLIVNQAKGESMEPFYERVPEALKGYIELVYDLNRSPSIRFIEGLLYNSRYYDPAIQSVTLSTISQDERPFVFSTPRLDNSGGLQINIPFADEGIDTLSEMRQKPQPFGYIKEVLGFDDRYDEQFLSLLTEEPPRRPDKYDEDAVRIRYFGHACVLIESKDISILTDPVISYDFGSSVYRYTFSDLPDTIDFVLITHTHQDHVLFETLLQLRHKIKNVIVPKCGGGMLEDPSLKLVLQKIGFKNVMEIDDAETIPVEGGSVMGVPFLGEHGDLNIRSKTGYFINLKGRKIMCSSDSRNIENKMYEHIHDLLGDIDVLFIGMECDGAPVSWIYGSLMTVPYDRKMDQSRRLSGSDFERAMDIVKRFNCSRVYVYAMGQEPWLGYITSIKYTDESRPIVESNKLLETCLGLGIPSERLYGFKQLFL